MDEAPVRVRAARRRGEDKPSKGLNPKQIQDTAGQSPSYPKFQFMTKKKNHLQTKGRNGSGSLSEATYKTQCNLPHSCHFIEQQ